MIMHVRDGGERERIGGMSDEALVFVHSPLVGPMTWRAVADRFTTAGHRTVLPELTGVMAGPPPYLPRIAAAVAGAADATGGPVILIAHSGAGPVLPGIASAVGVPVHALVYVDAGLPYPDQTWFERAPADLAAHLRSLASDGWLPPWHEWFSPAVLPELLPDPQLREMFIAELRPLPVGYFEERMPAGGWTGPAGYVLLSEAYRDDATRAAGLGMPVIEQIVHHLAMLSAPVTVAPLLAMILEGLTGHDRSETPRS